MLPEHVWVQDTKSTIMIVFDSKNIKDWRLRRQLQLINNQAANGGRLAKSKDNKRWHQM